MINLKKIPLYFLTLVAIWLTGYVLFCTWTLTSTPDNPERITDAIIVLTGGKNRIEEGLQLFAKGRARHLFITGVHPEVKQSDIEALWKGETALPPCCITLDHNAISTEQNAKESRKWFKKHHYSSIRLVTANYHMPRAMGEFHKMLPRVKIISHPIMQPGYEAFTKKFFIFSSAEYNKFLIRKVRLFFTFVQND